MANGADKYRSRRNRAKVRDLFWREWDPIGVNNNDFMSDEYDRYADKTYVMLMEEGKSSNEISSYLYWVASEYRGLGERPILRGCYDLVAEKLLALRPAFETVSNKPF
jgi:hypothetical protein